MLCLPAIVIAMTLVTATPAVAQRYVRTEMVGGPGGNLSEHTCGPGRVLVGIQGYGGVLLDNVQAICARVDANGLSDAKPEGPVFGGNRPINGSAKCPGDSAVVLAFIRENEKDPYVGLIELTCTGERQPVTLRGTGHLKGYTGPVLDSPSADTGDGKAIGCRNQPGENKNVAVGISVRAGQHLDAFGLICGPQPKTLNKRKKPADSTLQADRAKTTTSLPSILEEPAPASMPTPSPTPAHGASPTPASTNIDLPTPLKSNELMGDIKEQTPRQFYSFTAGPGEVVFTLDVTGAAPGGGAAYIYLIKPDAPDSPLASFDLFAVANSNQSLVKRVQFAEQQTIILRVGGNIGGGSYRLRISGAVEFN
jgi:hypothetical protein